MVAHHKGSGTLIQFGAGKPGESNSEEFERKLFRELKLEDPDIVFIPFHSLGPPPNDWTFFQAIYRPLTYGGIHLIELTPFSHQKDLKRLERRLAAADVIVLGSGLVEPYMDAILASGLQHFLADLHAKGKIFLGYSAGAISIGDGFRCYQTGEDLIEMLDELLAGPLKDLPMDQAFAAFCEVFYLQLPPARLQELYNRAKTRLAHPEDSLFLQDFHTMTFSPGLGFIPGVAQYPHFGEHRQTDLRILRHVAAQHPEVMHVGVPNGMAIVTTFEAGKPRMRARGHHPRYPITWLDPQGSIHHCVDQQEIPYPPQISHR